MFNLEIKTSQYKDGPVVESVVPDFPENVREAIAKYGEDAVYAGFLKSYVIAHQAKIRAEYKAPLTGTRTKRGSALEQAARARRMREASEAAASEIE